MRLAAVYIKEHFLFKEQQTINLGGKYFYTITPREGKDNEYDITRKENPNFIENFWGENISLVTAFVGENGAGKTSLLNDIFQNYKKENIIYIIENNLTTIFNHSINEPFNYWKIIDFKNINKSIIDFANESNLGYSVEKTMEFNNKLDFKIYNSLDFEYKTDSKTETKYIQLIKIFKFLIYDKVIVDEINDIYKININFYNKLSFKPNPFYYDDLFIEKEIEFYIQQKKEIITRENFLNLLELKEHRAFLVDLKNKNPYNYKDNLFTIKILFLSKIYATKYLMIYKKDRNKYIDWIYKTKIIDKFNDNEIFIKTVIDILLYDKNIMDQKLIDETIIYIKLFFKEIFTSLSFEVNKKNENKLFNLLNNYYRILFYFNSIEVQYNAKFFDKEIILFEPTHPISQGEYFLIQLFSNLNNIKSDEFKFLILDEADLGFHPYWKKKFVNLIVNILPKILTNSIINPLQIIITTHDPLTLSDIPNSNVVYLKKDGDKTKVLGEDEKPKKSFGANITDLLADSFFIGNGLIGDFAKGKIKEVIEFLNGRDSKIISKVECKKIIEIIDEPLMKDKLLEMYYEKYPEEYDNKKDIEDLERLAKKLNKKIKDA